MTQILTIRAVQETVAKHFRTDLQLMLGRRRSARLSWPRHVAIWSCSRVFPGRSLPELGRSFDRDHTSIMHAIRHVEDRRLDDAEVREETDFLIGLIGGEGSCVVKASVEAKRVAEEVARAFRLALLTMAVDDPAGFIQRASRLLTSGSQVAIE